MNNHNTLFYKIMRFVQRAEVKFHDLRTYTTFVWSIVGVILSGNPHFSHWQLYRRDETKAASKVRQFSRWLHNEKVDPMTIYRPIVTKILEDWSNQTLYLALDTSQIWQRFVMVRVSLVYCGRAIPLG